MHGVVERPLSSAHWLIPTGLLSLLGYLFICLNSRAFGAFTLPLLIGVITYLSLVWWAALRALHSEPTPRRLPHKRAILFWAVMFRLIGFVTYPPMEDDFIRYLWDGYANAHLGGAYATTPADFYGLDTIKEEMTLILDRVSYSDVHTVYGPICQLLFTLAHLISPGNIFALKFILLIFDLSALLILYKLLTHRALLLISWCPLMVFQFSVSAHVEMVGLTFLVSAIALSLSPKALNPHSLNSQKRLSKNSNRAHLFISVCLAFAVTSKVTALLAVPYFITHWKRCFCFLFTLIAIYIIGFYLCSGLPLGLMAMAEHWQFNALLHDILQRFIDRDLAKSIVLALFILIYVLLYLRVKPWQQKEGNPEGNNGTKEGEKKREREIMGSLTWSYAAFMLLSPVLNPWYWSWVCVVAAFTEEKWPWIISSILFISYGHGLNLPAWPTALGLYEIPAMVLYCEYLVIIAIIGFAIAKRAHR